MGVSNGDGLDGNEWERLVHRCLRIRYPMGDYHHVPDEHGGDGGIEGFSTDGCAFQWYSHEGELTVADLYERQRDKMSTDIKKFIDNRDVIARRVSLRAS